MWSADRVPVWEDEEFWRRTMGMVVADNNVTVLKVTEVYT